MPKQPRNTPGRGRPALSDETMRQTAFRLEKKHFDLLDEISRKHGRIGRNAALRKLLDDYRIARAT